MLVIAPVDRKVEIKAHPDDESTTTTVKYIGDSHLVQVKSSQYYRRKIAARKLICVSETDKPPKDWYKKFHPVQIKRIKEAAQKRAAHDKAEAKKAAEAKKKKAAEDKKKADEDKKKADEKKRDNKTNNSAATK